jgi:lambda family phage minor tail protein L
LPVQRLKARRKFAASLNPSGIATSSVLVLVVFRYSSASERFESSDIVEFELATPLDVEGVRLPRRQVICNARSWRYRGDGCGYAGPPVADINDNPTSDPNADACGKRLKSCKLRFGNGWMPFGGFPGAGQYR